MRPELAMDTLKTQLLTSRLVDFPSDLDEYVRVRCLNNPYKPITREEFEKDLANQPKDQRNTRRVYFRDGEMVALGGVAENVWGKEKNQFFGRATTTGLSFDETLEVVADDEADASEFGATIMRYWMDDMNQTLIDVLVSKGYEKTQSNNVSKLDLTTFDPSPFASKVDAFDAAGFGFLSMTELKEKYGDKFMRMLYDVDWKFMQDVPVPWELKQRPYEEFEKDFNAYEEMWPWVMQVMDGDEIVAQTMLFPSKADSTLIFTGLTATLREYRRRGIATAIKVKNLMRAKEAGKTKVLTDNEKDNPMLQLNYQLGFRDIYNDVCYEKSL